ncbi:hypothetical protein AAG906_018902 [Vitis piasezkii]
MSTSSLEQAILKISKVMEDFVGENQCKRSRKVLMIDTLVGIAMTTLWTNLPLKIIRYDACKNQSYGEKKKKRENRGEKSKQSNSHHPISATVGHISSTSRSSFHAYYISFQSLGSQESIASNGARFGVETKKLWPCTHFATVGHVFGALSGAQIMHTISLFEA